MITLFPAIDIKNGQAVRLYQGQDGTQTTYGDPLQIAKQFVAEGAQWIHIVDLDAAFGHGHNTQLIERLCATISINLEVSGGIRDDASLERVLRAGAQRVNIGTAALENPQWTARAIERYGQAIAVGLDVRGHELAGRGWTSKGGNLWDVLSRLDDAGCARYVVTDVHKDGTLSGPNLELLASVCDKTSRPVIASGGISTCDDIRQVAMLHERGVEGVIVGKALYSGQFTLRQALEACTGR